MSNEIKIIDFHSHVLPLADHGSKSIEQSIRQLALMKDYGTDIAVATPHFYPHVHNANDFLKITEASQKLLLAQGSVRAPDLCVGAEVLLCRNLYKMKLLDELCIRGTKNILIELPLSKPTFSYDDEISELISAGYTVILAHIDRYVRALPEEIYSLLSLGAYAQVNADALNHLVTYKKIVKLSDSFDSRTIVALGSDLHGDDRKDYKPFATASAKLGARYSPIMHAAAQLLVGAETLKLS